MYDCAHAATAPALSGELPAARELFDAALALREEAWSAQWKAAEWMLEARAAANDESVFRVWASAAVTGTRQAELCSQPFTNAVHASLSRRWRDVQDCRRVGERGVLERHKGEQVQILLGQ